VWRKWLREVSENAENAERSGCPKVPRSADNVKKAHKIVVQTF
jgi:hypothetical protein